jgi:CBS domain-containing protein
MFEIANIMSTDLVTVHPSASLYHARELMNEKGIRHLPVVNHDGKLVGLLTQSDVLAASDSILKDRDSQLDTAFFPVEDAMVTEIDTVSPQANVRLAAKYLERHKIGCLPVVEGGALVGIVTDSDFVAVAINLLEQLEDFEPESED